MIAVDYSSSTSFNEELFEQGSSLTTLQTSLGVTSTSMDLMSLVPPTRLTTPSYLTSLGPLLRALTPRSIDERLRPQ